MRQMKDLQEKAQDVRNPAARRKSLQRVRKAMPKQPAEFANTATDLIKKASPRKAAAMRDKNISSTERRIEAALQEVVASCLSEPKQSATRRSVGRTMHILKKHKLTRKASKRYQQFMTANPDVKISISNFFQLRPKHVKTQQRSR